MASSTFILTRDILHGKTSKAEVPRTSYRPNFNKDQKIAAARKLTDSTGLSKFCSSAARSQATGSDRVSENIPSVPPTRHNIDMSVIGNTVRLKQSFAFTSSSLPGIGYHSTFHVHRGVRSNSEVKMHVTSGLKASHRHREATV
ncbi:hypothetical protein HYALB_00008834 [Hymenoscyphus albidus]|uniref:Uncharacterized protein n=1 Tax=Hymenoscyphus albidus TaxID=595503 RepID=A0A9N9M1Y5_9HELO|nr:hypothetical protein HYALB_00008834 [Hymenoscyphus albidus]